MRPVFTLLSLVFITLSVRSQQLPQHTLYVQNNFLLNPAVAGIENYIDLRAGYRTQWVGMEGAPTSFYASFHTSLNKNDRNTKRLSMRNNGSNPGSGANTNNRFYIKPHHGLGAVAQVDKAGLLKTSSLSLSYAYHLPLTSRINLAGGLLAGIKQYRLNVDALDLVTPNDPFEASDFSNMNKADLGVGLWLYSNSFFLGVSGMQLLRSNSNSAEGGPYATLQKHYFATSGIKIKASSELALTPSLMVKMAESGVVMVDGNAKLTYNDRFWTGISYRHNDAFAGAVGIYINHMLDVSYSYDVTTSAINTVSANTHEVVIGLKLNNAQKVLCPQWVW
ncbi:type IX secretion system membrane protein PorP/SprF [Pontibacter locisalis]|uniref:Type IX secretion system membrane protein PorP/SprF n=1 Tax=Pontibacter locisalis TaxID=1719035 RepID=A0ABW5IMW0_9BACT